LAFFASSFSSSSIFCFNVAFITGAAGSVLPSLVAAGSDLSILEAFFSFFSNSLSLSI
jgi:hypothetical protein